MSSSGYCPLKVNGPPSVAIANQISKLRCQGYPTGFRLNCDWIIIHESWEDLTNHRERTAEGGGSEKVNHRIICNDIMVNCW